MVINRANRINQARTMLSLTVLNKFVQVSTWLAAFHLLILVVSFGFVIIIYNSQIFEYN